MALRFPPHKPLCTGRYPARSACTRATPTKRRKRSTALHARVPRTEGRIIRTRWANLIQPPIRQSSLKRNNRGAVCTRGRPHGRPPALPCSELWRLPQSAGPVSWFHRVLLVIYIYAAGLFARLQSSESALRLRAHLRNWRCGAATRYAAGKLKYGGPAERAGARARVVTERAADAVGGVE